MKNKAKKLLTVVLVLCALILIAPVMEARADARLSKEDATILIGDTLQLKVKGSNKTVKWSSSNNAVATVNQKGKVTAKSEGYAIIYAKAGKETLSCWVDVNFNDSAAKKNIKILSQMVRGGAIAAIQNNYELDVVLDVSFAFYDKSGKLVDTGEDLYINVAKGNVSAAYSETDNDSAVSAKAVISEIRGESHANLPGKIKISELNPMDEEVVLKSTNSGNKKFEEVRISCLFYKDDEIVGCARELIYNLSSKSYEFVKFSVPSFETRGYDEDGNYDWNYEYLDYDKCGIIVDYAYY